MKKELAEELNRQIHPGTELISGPCISCGEENYSLSLGGPQICPACDCGVHPEITRLSNRTYEKWRETVVFLVAKKEIPEKLRTELLTLECQLKAAREKHSHRQFSLP